MSWDEFKSKHKEMIENAASGNYTITYENRYLWELTEYPEIPFDKALNVLRAFKGDIFFMSENWNDYYGFRIDGTEYRGVVVKANARELADIIEFEWYEGWRLSAINMHLDDAILPEDLYVFDESMENLLIFTHENDFWELELEQPMVAAASRYCKICGFNYTVDQNRS